MTVDGVDSAAKAEGSAAARVAAQEVAAKWAVSGAAGVERSVAGRGREVEAAQEDAETCGDGGRGLKGTGGGPSEGNRGAGPEGPAPGETSPEESRRPLGRGDPGVQGLRCREPSRRMELRGS